MSSNGVFIGQAVTVLAQVVDAFDPTDFLLNTGANISAVSYTAYFIRNGAFSQGTPVAVTGHTNVNVSTDCVLTALQTSEKWTLDNNGFSFALTPDVTTSPLFDTVGDYQIKVTITPTVGNPIVFYVPITVKPLEN